MSDEGKGNIKKLRHAYFILDGNILLNILKKVSSLPKDSALVNIHVYNESSPKAKKYAPELLIKFESKKNKQIKEGYNIPEVTVIIREVRMKEISEKLKAVKKGKPDAYKIIGAVSGLGEKRVKEIAEGSEVSVIELNVLETLS